jgi:uncharacterized protein (TIGR02147 family)
MVNVFEYTDFRKYLSDYYENRKKGNPRFSYQVIANKAGIKNKGFIYNIINGKKILSKSNIFKLSRALGHNRHEADYFEHCVAFNQTNDTIERKNIFEKMTAVKDVGRGAGGAQLLRRDQYEFVSNWRHVAVRSIIGMFGFKGDYKRLAGMVNPPITVPQAKHSVQLLEKLDLIKKGKNNGYTVTENGLTTGKDVMNVAFQNFHLDCTDLAKRAIAVFPMSMRDITGLTLGISRESYERIREEIRIFQNAVMDIANADQASDRVYQLNFHFFPLSDIPPEKEKS